MRNRIRELAQRWMPQQNHYVDGGMEVIEEDAPDATRLDSATWGKARVKTSLADLHELEPLVKVHREGCSICWGAGLGEVVRQHLTPEETQVLVTALAHRVVRELHDAALEVAQAQRAFEEERRRKLRR